MRCISIVGERVEEYVISCKVLFVSLKSHAEKYCSLIYCKRKILYHGWLISQADKFKQTRNGDLL